MHSKSKIDKAGRILSDPKRLYDELALELDYIFEDFRREHLAPLTRLTLDLQEWLHTYQQAYFIAQRLKRRPQILRKLRRFSIRLSQLQDIGGCRIVVEGHKEAEELIQFLHLKILHSKVYDIERVSDYRDWGRDDSGYRAYHLVIRCEGFLLELQIRNRLQHYWSESIERTSVIYGFRLKEQEGDRCVLNYFKIFSTALHILEQGQRLSTELEIDLQRNMELADAVISQSIHHRHLEGHVNESIISTMVEVERRSEAELNNWILVFDWTDGNFVFWDNVGRNPIEAIEAYSRYESQYPEEEKYEVVMIGSSDISTVKHTHSHYFGIEHHSRALEDMESKILGLSRRMSMDVGARRILAILKRQGRWGKKTIKIATLKNHFCQNIATFDASLDELRKAGFVIGDDPISLDIKKNREINDLT